MANRKTIKFFVGQNMYVRDKQNLSQYKNPINHYYNHYQNNRVHKKRNGRKA